MKKFLASVLALVSLSCFTVLGSCSADKENKPCNILTSTFLGCQDDNAQCSASSFSEFYWKSKPWIEACLFIDCTVATAYMLHDILKPCILPA